MEVGDIHIQIAQHCHGLFHGVGNIVELQIQKDLVTPGFDFPDDGRTLGIVQLHADLDKGLAAGEFVQKCEGGLSGRKITRNNDIFTHYFTPPIISLRF